MSSLIATATNSLEQDYKELKEKYERQCKLLALVLDSNVTDENTPLHLIIDAFIEYLNKDAIKSIVTCMAPLDVNTKRLDISKSIKWEDYVHLDRDKKKDSRDMCVYFNVLRANNVWAHFHLDGIKCKVSDDVKNNSIQILLDTNSNENKNLV